MKLLIREFELSTSQQNYKTDPHLQQREQMTSIQV